MYGRSIGTRGAASSELWWWLKLRGVLTNSESVEKMQSSAAENRVVASLTHHISCVQGRREPWIGWYIRLNTWRSWGLLWMLWAHALSMLCLPLKILRNYDCLANIPDRKYLGYYCFAVGNNKQTAVVDPLLTQLRFAPIFSQPRRMTRFHKYKLSCQQL